MIIASAGKDYPVPGPRAEPDAVVMPGVYLESARAQNHMTVAPPLLPPQQKPTTKTPAAHKAAKQGSDFTRGRPGHINIRSLHFGVQAHDAGL